MKLGDFLGNPEAETCVCGHDMTVHLRVPATRHDTGGDREVTLVECSPCGKICYEEEME